MERGEAVQTWKARRRTSPGQVEALERLRPAYAVAADRPLDATAVFGRRAPLVLEIGSGTGEAAVAMAAADPSRDLLAVEVHTPGIATLLRAVEEQGLGNVRVVEGDGLQVLREALGPASLDEVRVYFPDPWPKSRHHKRRLVTPAFAALVADRLRPGGRLHVATDWASYAEQVLEVVDGSPHLELVSRSRGARPLTRFERRGIAAGRPIADLVAVRASRRPVPGGQPGQEQAMTTSPAPSGPQDPHDGIDPRANREARAEERDQTSSVARGGQSSGIVDTGPAPGDEQPSQAVGGGTSGGDPLSGVGASAQDVEDAVSGDTGPEHAGQR